MSFRTWTDCRLTNSAVIQTDTSSTEMKGGKDIVLFLRSNNAQRTTSAVRWQIGSDARPKKKKKRPIYSWGSLSAPAPVPFGS